MVRGTGKRPGGVGPDTRPRRGRNRPAPTADEIIDSRLDLVRQKLGEALQLAGIPAERVTPRVARIMALIRQEVADERSA